MNDKSKHGRLNKRMWLSLQLVATLVLTASLIPLAATYAAAAPDKADLNDFLVSQGKPLTVTLEKQKNDKWIFKFEPKLDGATAKVPMDNGNFLELSIKQKNNDWFVPCKFSKENATVTVRVLPDGKIGLCTVSKKIYGNRFRLVLQVGGIAQKELYFVEDKKLK